MNPKPAITANSPHLTHVATSPSLIVIGNQYRSGLDFAWHADNESLMGFELAIATLLIYKQTCSEFILLFA
ncbi:MAG: hypothetical protein KME55_13885 [Nostoc indistinguendum CM1-VF10]|nr:hypothetical protein [Nostoc indistinguendum CM1-VF10]